MDLRLSEARSPRGLLILKAVGELDTYTAPTLRELVIDWVVRLGRYEFAIDLTDVDFVDSTGMMVLTGAFKRTRAHDGWLALIISRDQERIRKIFRITGLVKVFSVVESAARLDSWAFEQKKPRLSAKDVEASGNWLPIRVYLSDSEARQSVEQALREVTVEFGVDYVYSFPGETGSWWREHIAHMRESGTQSQQLAKLERAIDMQLLLIKQAQVDGVQSDAVSKLIVALERTPQAVIQVGSVLLVKVEQTIVVRNLTQGELQFYERNPALFKDPVNALLHLQRAAEAQGPATPLTGHEYPPQETHNQQTA